MNRPDPAHMMGGQANGSNIFRTIPQTTSWPNSLAGWVARRAKQPCLAIADISCNRSVQSFKKGGQNNPQSGGILHFIPRLLVAAPSGKHSATFPFFGFPPSKLRQPLKHQQLVSELRETGTLDLIDALNPTVASICPYDHWLSLHHWKHSPPFRFSEFRPNKFIPHTDHQNYSQKIREGGSLDIFDDLNPAVVSVCPYEPLVVAPPLKTFSHFPIFGTVRTLKFPADLAGHGGWLSSVISQKC